MTIRAVIVDDERIIGADLARQIAKRRSWEVVGTFHDPLEFQSWLKGAAVEVCFLDIEMPGIDGMSLARDLKERYPGMHLVFVTAHAQFAAAAFRVDAIDFLVKPPDSAVLEQACGRIERRLAATPDNPPSRIAVVSSGRVDFVHVDEILAVKASGNYVALVTERGEFLHRTSFSDFLARMASVNFLRTHRSYALRPEAVASAKTRGGDVVEATLTTGAAIPVSAAYRDFVTARLNAAII